MARLSRPPITAYPGHSFQYCVAVAAYCRLQQRAQLASSFMKAASKQPMDAAAMCKLNIVRQQRRQRQAIARLRVRCTANLAVAHSYTAISVTQPNASLIAWKIKRFEGKPGKVLTVGKRLWIASTKQLTARFTCRQCSHTSLQLGERCKCQHGSGRTCQFLQDLLAFDCAELRQKLGKRCEELTAVDIDNMFPRGMLMASVKVVGCVSGATVQGCHFKHAYSLDAVQAVPVALETTGAPGVYPIDSRIADSMYKYFGAN